VTLLDPRFLARLEALQLGTRRRLAGQLSGDHRSTRFGSSLDFADYRDYHPGDDFRRIDYHLLARLDVPLVKLFEAEEDVHLRLLVDTSASMATGQKLQQAARVAAALGFVALVRRDPVMLHTFPLEAPPARFVGRGAAGRLFATLEALEPHGETAFAAATTDLLTRRGPGGITVVVSDLLTPEWRSGIERLPAAGHDVVVVQVLARTDLRPTETGDVDVVDAETGDRVAVSLTTATADAFQRRAGQWMDEVADRARRAGAAYVSLFDDDDLEGTLLAGWRSGGVLR
jgi:uncharacterized protein (DUF58 family)